MDTTSLTVGILAVLGGLYLWRRPRGRWNRFAAEHTEMFRDPDAEEKMARGAPVVGALLMLGGLILLAASVVVV